MVAIMVGVQSTQETLVTLTPTIMAAIVYSPLLFHFHPHGHSQHHKLSGISVQLIAKKHKFDFNSLKVVVSSSILHNINMRRNILCTDVHKCLKKGLSYYFRGERDRGPCHLCHQSFMHNCITVCVFPFYKANATSLFMKLQKH